MLPKVANTLLHHTSRAVAAVQNQTGYTIRNVLQLQSSSSSPSTGNLGPWNGASSSNSGWNGHGAGPGGAKYQSGSRFYTGYSGAGRAVTQADTSSSNAAAQAYNDDSDERTPVKAVQSLRPRRSSFTFQDRKDDKLGLLKTTQLHTRAHHTIAQRSTSSQSTSTALIPSRPVTPALITAAPGTSVRHETTAAISHGDVADVDSAVLSQAAAQEPASPQEPVPAVEATHAPTFLEDVSMYAVLPEESPSEQELKKEAAAIMKDLEGVENRGERSITTQLERVMKASRPYPVEVWSQAMTAATRLDTSRTVKYTLELYQAMLAQSVPPTGEIYHQVICAYARRDYTIFRLSFRKNGWQNYNESVEGLSQESNFTAAMTLFQAACNIPNTKLPLSTYNTLLRLAGIHRNVDAAIYVFAQLEKRVDVTPTALTYSNLIQVYARVRDLNGAKEVFEEFKEASRTNRLAWDLTDEAQETLIDDYAPREFNPRTRQTLVWHRMIEAYFRCGQPTGSLALLEQMLDTTAGPEFHPDQVPPPTQATFANIIKGFCELRDIRTARSWFERLLLQETSPADDYAPQLVPTRPNARAWTTILTGLIKEEAWGELLDVLSKLHQYTERDNLSHITFDIKRAFSGVLHYVSRTSNDVPVREKEVVDLFSAIALQHDLATLPTVKSHPQSQLFATLVLEEYIRLGHIEAGLQFFENVTLHERKYIDDGHIPALDHDRRVPFQHFLDVVPQRFLRLPALTLPDVLRLAQVSDIMASIHRSGTLYLQAYSQFRKHADLSQLSAKDWAMLLRIGCVHLKEAANPIVEKSVHVSTLQDIVKDMVKNFPALDTLASEPEFRPQFCRDVVVQLRTQYGDDIALPLVRSMGHLFESNIASSDAVLQYVHAAQQRTVGQSIPMKTGSSKSYHIDLRLSKMIDDLMMQPGGSAQVAWNNFNTAERRGIAPKPATLGHMISFYGRKRDMAKVEYLYQVAQELVVKIKEEQWRRAAWDYIENCMIVAFAHCDAIDRAYVHRDRIIASGSVPNSDAYGALLLNVTDTTDDASNAMALWNEAISRGLLPSTYMYNNIISKLAKARRADECLVMFEDLKARGLQPSSVTYGTIISAMCRVGNEQQAAAFFEEMTQHPAYRPRVPPYNTMMQFYTYTKPDRERVLYYYDLMQKAKVQPTSHTYKVLMDVFGTIEPVDEAAVNDIFAQVTSGGTPLVQGVHWASLINMYGCVKKDLDKAIEVFDSISAHPSTARVSTVLPDATVFEALINVIVSLHRFDMLEPFMQRLWGSNMHMTAYIANIIIKGYASAGDIASARTFFETMQDPPQGIAAPHNRTTHEDRDETVLPADIPVYREPSTWEEMIRAELRSGSRQKAIDLLTRVQQRQYPVGVYNRISGILLQHDSQPSPLDVESPVSSSPKTGSYEPDSPSAQSSQTSI
ncbi:hypothetical protein CERSUDRAFT_119378 [Gelatoporia subvermispora B]|uniref:Pentacotripeptide-repeat region of PRORP domain-containing protein n=1 Tax=Ceriporiopsis subvermispora (strain B) TaxID=914234 RepID=M2R0N3_CERS8|nr:hypothetical protein CERSUDRAFT_119378 [Gelatoporia subvermispora B]